MLSNLNIFLPSPPPVMQFYEYSYLQYYTQTHTNLLFKLFLDFYDNEKLTSCPERQQAASNPPMKRMLTSNTETSKFCWEKYYTHVENNYSVII